MKNLSLITILIWFFSISASAQNSTEYFYEFCIPGLNTADDAQKVANILTELGTYSARPDHFSKKVICLSNKLISEKDFSKVLNNESYYLFFFKSGIQGVDLHDSKSIDQWNATYGSSFESKQFIAIGKGIFKNDQKNEIKKLVELNDQITNITYSLDNKKAIISTTKIASRNSIKNIFDDYESPNHLLDLIEINLK